ncbi:uncharacterized protein EHS24_004221 [Apiotrichum porosum]|uniref:Phenazine biosynthesis protein n=1 Tax=Apiotrichum porosum TaxID=105984 RepID=A0A427Y4L7_9TREE|nr:uncharacterized protein EHS24_004221 [Apiotrichum porosum]RSH86022.1 hypothetical protein EHS24_004221 [Apiotrichum porosum]
MSQLPLLPFTLVNAFAPTPHAGNPASVVLFPKNDPRAEDNDDYFVTLARDFNLSETVFLSPIHAEDVIPQYSIRWFTPTVEVPLCGHGTAAAANVLFTLHPQAIRVHLQTRERGQLAATLEGTANGDKAVLVGLDLPIAPPREVDAAEHADIAAAVCGIAWFSPEHIVRIATFGDRSVIVQVDERVRIGELAVDASKFLPKFPHHVVVTQLLPPPDDTVTGTDPVVHAACRVFAPAHGVDEDPVTGAVWAVLTGYYLSGPASADAQALLPRGHPVADATLDAHQLSKRGGQLTCTLTGEGRAKVVGKTWRTGKGFLEVFDEE